MSRLRPEEEWARIIIAAHLETEVEAHDIGPGDSLYDLEIRYPDGRVGAVEVVAAADPEVVEFWNLANGDDSRWLDASIAGGWAVACKPSARVKNLRSKLPLLLQGYESLGITRFDRRLRSESGPLDKIARGLGITHAMKGPTDFPGSIYLIVDLPAEQRGAMVADNGDAAATWIGTFLKEPDQQDVLSKLRLSNADERHAFVILPGFTTAPYSVVDPLIRIDCLPPTLDPELPKEATHVWIASTWTISRALFWSPTARWQWVSGHVKSSEH